MNLFRFLKKTLGTDQKKMDVIEAHSTFGQNVEKANVSDVTKSEINSDFPFATPNDDEAFTPFTTAIEEINACALGLAVHHSVCETMVDNYPQILGNFLGKIFYSEPRLKMQCNATTCALAVHCGIESAKSFLAVLRANSFETGISVTPNNKLKIENGLLIMGCMDFYEAGRLCAIRKDLEFAWNPYNGPAGRLWSSGYRGIPRNSPEVEEDLEDYSHIFLDIEAT